MDCVGGPASISGSPRTWLNSNSVANGFGAGHVEIDLRLGFAGHFGSGCGKAFWTTGAAFCNSGQTFPTIIFILRVIALKAVIPRRLRRIQCLPNFLAAGGVLDALGRAIAQQVYTPRFTALKRVNQFVNQASTTLADTALETSLGLTRDSGRRTNECSPAIGVSSRGRESAPDDPQESRAASASCYLGRAAFCCIWAGPFVEESHIRVPTTASCVIRGLRRGGVRTRATRGFTLPPKAR